MVRCFSGASDINCGLNATVTTAVNGGTCLAELNSDPVLGPVFTLLEVFFTLLVNNNYSPHTPRDKHRLVMLSFLTSDFGYLPLQLLAGYLYAGHQDTLSESLALLQFVWKEYPDYRSLIRGAVSFSRGGQGAEEQLQLVVQPSALNIRRPALPGAFLKEKVEDFLVNSGRVRNKQLRTMFQGCSKVDQLNLGQELLKIRPIDTNLTNSLFTYSHIGSLLGTLSRFNRISSIVKLVGANKPSEEGVCFSQKVLSMDEANLKYYFNRIKHVHSIETEFIPTLLFGCYKQFEEFCAQHKMLPRCIFSARLFLISYTYHLGSNLITGPYTPPPAEQLIFQDAPITKISTSGLLIHPGHLIPPTLHELETIRGPYKLYIGSRTGDPVKSIKLTSLEGIEAGTAIRAMLRILAWCHSTSKDPNLIDFISSQLSSRLGGLSNVISGVVPGTAGGTFFHRFIFPGGVMWAFINSTSIISTWYHITSNCATALQRGEDDRYIFFQQLYQHIYAALRFCTPYTHSIQAIVRLDHCSYLVPDEPFTAPPLNIPGLQHMEGGLILDEGRRRLLEAEAQHNQQLMQFSRVSTVPPDMLLMSVISYEVSRHISSYLRGFIDHSSERHLLYAGQSKLNITLLRGTAMEPLLQHIAISLAYSGFFGRRLSLKRLRAVLSVRSQVALAGVSGTPFIDLLQGLITAGRLSALIQYSQSSWQWDVNQSLVTLLPILLSALSRAIAALIENPQKVYLLLVVSASSFPYPRVLDFLKRWSPDLYRLIDVNQHLPADRLINFLAEHSASIVPIVVTESGLALESARRRLKEQQPTSDGPIGVPPNSSTVLRFDQPLVPPWISLPVSLLPCSSIEDPLHESRLAEWSSALVPNTTVTHLQRWNQGPSHGAPKLAEILNLLHVFLTPASLVVALAEGSGSFLSYCLHTDISLHGYYNSLLNPDDLPSSMAGLYKAPGLLCQCSIDRRVVNFPYRPTTNGDLRLSSTWSQIYQELYDDGHHVSLLTCDPNWDQQDNHLWLRNLANAVPVVSPYSIVVKVILQHVTVEALSELATLVSNYKRCYWIKPSYSNLYSGELYLVCSVHLSSPNPVRVLDLRPVCAEFNHNF